jgi:hypothetical protein
MVRGVVRDLDLRADSVPTSNAGIARVERRIVNATALATFLEAFAGEPVIAPAWLPLLTVGVVSARLAGNVGALQRAGLEAVFGSLPFGFGGKIAWLQKFVDESLILTDAVCEHTTMVAIVVETPLDIYNVASCISNDRLAAPLRTRLVV